jgi:DNA polymerase-3 subunit epsilon
MKNLTLDRPLAFFDLETTGTSPESDRIVEVSVLVVRPGGGEDLFTRRVHPGRPIPAEATAVHGISDADVRDCPAFEAIAPDLGRLLLGCDLAGFNVIAYDLPLLEAEFGRAQVAFSRTGRRLIDALRIFHLKEARNLTAAVRFYVGREHDGAHGAEADTLAAMEVLDAQIAHYPDLPRDVEGLARLCKPEGWIDSQGKIRWAAGEPVLGFGQHRGKSLRQMARAEASYLRWIVDKSDLPADTKWVVREAIEGRYPERKE